MNPLIGSAKRLGRSFLYSRPTRVVLRRNPALSSAVMRAVLRLDGERANTGFSDEARYCYSVWMRHMVMAAAHGLNAEPGAIVELGPGDSLGIGLCGMLCGADRLYSLDAFRYANGERTLAVLDGLVELISSGAKIPGRDEYPDVKPIPASFEFPAAILSPERRERALHPDRLRRVRAAIAGGMDGADHEGVSIRYAAPWEDASVVPTGTADLVFSQAVMEHVRELDATYAATAVWLRRGGFVSHQVDFRSHGTSADWNGHWIYPEEVWNQLENEKVYRWINRQPCSAHVALLEGHGLRTVATVPVVSSDGIERGQLASRWRHLSDDDLRCQAALILAVKQ